MRPKYIAFDHRTRQATNRKRQLCWFVHVQCTEYTKRAKQVLHWVHDKNSKRGRPHNLYGYILERYQMHTRNIIRL